MKIDIKFIIWLILISLVYYYFGGVTGTKMLIVSIVLFLLALIQGLYLSNSIFAEFKHNDSRIEVGDQVKEKMIVKNKSFMTAPLVEVVAEELKEQRFFSIPAKDDIQITYDLTPKVRGIVKTGTIELRTSDVLNITKSTKKLYPDKIKVYPKVPDRRADKLLFDTLGDGNLFRTYSRENPYVIRELRKYRPGDNIRKINWKVSAKLSELYVRKGETTEEKDILIVLDMNETILFMDSEGIFENTLVTDALSMSKAILKMGIPHGFIMNDNRRQLLNVFNMEAYEKLEEDLLITKATFKDTIKDFVIQKNEFLLERGTVIFFTIFNKKNFEEIGKLKHSQNEVIVCSPNLDFINGEIQDSGIKLVSLKGDGYEVGK